VWQAQGCCLGEVQVLARIALGIREGDFTPVEFQKFHHYLLDFSVGIFSLPINLPGFGASAVILYVWGHENF
jgi:hypothetical protein